MTVMTSMILITASLRSIGRFWLVYIGTLGMYHYILCLFMLFHDSSGVLRSNRFFTDPEYSQIWVYLQHIL